MLIVAPALAAPRAQPVPIEVPLVGQPPYYWGAVGTRFQLSTQASQTELYVGKTFQLTVRVTAIGPFQRPPERPLLEEVPRFKERFKIDWLTKGRAAESSKPDRVLPDQRSWEFHYRLRAVSDQVERVPPLPFAWYRPNRNPKLRGTFETTWDDGIDLKVKPIPTDKAKTPAKPIQVPDAFLQIATSPALLRHEEVFRTPSVTLLALLILLPPTLGALCYIGWRRLNPDAARLARRRQSRAAVVALRDLNALGTRQGPERVQRTLDIAITYLRDRLHLPSVEPTPAEVTVHLSQAGTSLTSVKQAADFFHACDAARFAPVHNAKEADLAALVRQLITALEAEA